MSWRLIETWDGPGDWNLAVDHWLLEDPRDPEEAVLRFYTWDPPTLSLGHFQKVADVPACEGREPGATLVRRESGGGAIHHARELTFSIAANLTHPLYEGSIRDSYARVHGLLANVLERHGAHSSLRREQGLASDRAGTGMCFHESHDLDLVWSAEGGLRKGVGSAQRRKRGRVLHHGSIKLGHDPLEPGVSHVPGDLTPASLARELALEICGRALEPEPLTEAELAAVERDHRPIFSDREWTLRR